MKKARGKKKRVVRSVHVHIPQYCVWVTGLLGWTPEQVRYFFRKKFECDSPCDDEPDGRSVAMNHPREGFHVIVYLSRWDQKPETISLLAHECLHASFQILESIGQPVCTKDHEHLTYMHQYIFQTLWTEQLKMDGRSA